MCLSVCLSVTNNDPKYKYMSQTHAYKPGRKRKQGSSLARMKGKEETQVLSLSLSLSPFSSFRVFCAFLPSLINPYELPH